jgi:hypothetical protein
MDMRVTSFAAVVDIPDLPIISHPDCECITANIICLKGNISEPIAHRQKRNKFKDQLPCHPLPPSAPTLPHPSTSPQHLHIRSTTLIFSARPKSGFSRSPTSSRNPSRSRDRAGRHVSAYLRRCVTESKSRPVVSGGMRWVANSS